jgi:hypothetical protein
MTAVTAPAAQCIIFLLVGGSVQHGGATWWVHVADPATCTYTSQAPAHPRMQRRDGPHAMMGCLTGSSAPAKPLLNRRSSFSFSAMHPHAAPVSTHHACGCRAHAWLPTPHGVHARQAVLLPAELTAGQTTLLAGCPRQSTRLGKVAYGRMNKLQGSAISCLGIPAGLGQHAPRSAARNSEGELEKRCELTCKCCCRGHLAWTQAPWAVPYSARPLSAVKQGSRAQLKVPRRTNTDLLQIAMIVLESMSICI